MGQLDKKQLNIFAKALMPVLYEIQAGSKEEFNKSISILYAEEIGHTGPTSNILIDLLNSWVSRGLLPFGPLALCSAKR